MKVVVDEPDVLAAQPKWWLDGAEYAVLETKRHSGTLLAKLAGIESPEHARQFKGKPVVIERPEAGEGRIYWTDLVGLEVVNMQGVVLGAVKQMSNNGAHDIIEVQGAKSHLLPFVPAYVMRVDLQAKRIEVDWQADW